MLQQILFYRELGFELKRIKEILGQAKFEKVAALKSHRKVLEKKAARTAGRIEEFFQVLSTFKELPTREQALNSTYTDEQTTAMQQLFEAHGMILTGPPLLFSEHTA